MRALQFVTAAARCLVLCLPLSLAPFALLGCARGPDTRAGDEQGAVRPPPADAGPRTSGARQASVAVLLPEGPLPFRVELADDDPSRARGLMFREALGDDEGMLFIFERSQMLSFWMRNTLIPLDMIFIDERGVAVSIIESAEPLTETARRSTAPARYVLEVKGGTCGKRGIEAGVHLRFDGIPGHPVAAPAGVR